MKHSRKKHTSRLAPKFPDSIAELANGMADDFNNILTTLMGACSLIDKDEPVNKELLQYVALIRASAERAAVLSDKLVRVSTQEQQNSLSGSFRLSCGSIATSFSDKISNDDIVSANNPKDGASS